MAGISRAERERRALEREAAQMVEPPPQPPAGDERKPTRACDRENPAMLSGEELRRLAHMRGISRSEAARTTDEKLRQQIRTRDYMANKEG